MATKGLLRLILTLGVAIATGMATAQSLPTSQQIAQAFKAETRCVVADPHRILSNYQVAYLDYLIFNALHLADSELSEWPESGHSDEYLPVQRMRQKQDYSLDGAFQSLCLSGNAASFRALLSRFTAADASAYGDVAWVALLTPNGEWIGPGLVFLRENGAWRYSRLQTDVVGFALNESEFTSQFRTALATDYNVDDTLALHCPMPPAPEAIKPYRIFDFDETDISVELGVAQRLAARRLASPRSGRPSAVAQLIYAEALLRSLNFWNAPEAGSPEWVSRVERAGRLFEHANSGGANLSRFAPYLLWMAALYRDGVGVQKDWVRGEGWQRIADAVSNDETERGPIVSPSAELIDRLPSPSVLDGAPESEILIEPDCS